MLAGFIDERVVIGAVDAEDLARAAEGDEGAVGAEVGREDEVVLLAGFDQAFARLDVEDDDAAGLAAAPASGDEQVAIS